MAKGTIKARIAIVGASDKSVVCLSYSRYAVAQHSDPVTAPIPIITWQGHSFSITTAGH